MIHPLQRANIQMILTILKYDYKFWKDQPVMNMLKFNGNEGAIVD